MPGNADILPLAPGRPLVRSVGRLARALARQLSGFARLEKMADTLPQCGDPQTFATACLTALDVHTECLRGDLERIPARGPVVLFANHPSGALEGLMLAALCGKARPDLKILASDALLRIPQLAQLAPMLLPLNLSGGAAANAAVLRTAMTHLRSGGALGIFPSGSVARWQFGRGIAEQPWSRLLSRLGGRNADIPGLNFVPLHMSVRQNPLFIAATALKENVGEALLPNTLFKQRGSTARMIVGEAIPAEILTGLNHEQRTHCLGLCRSALGSEHGAAGHAANCQPLAPAAAKMDIMVSLAALPENRMLAREGRYCVYLLEGDESPLLLDELTRRREEAFRALGEGSGQARDTDHYDPLYSHLLLMDEEGKNIAGSYRARVVRPEGTWQYDKKRLYTASLFEYEPEFFRQCGNALELGRAFVCPEYQRDYTPLLLLWKGIGQMALRNGVRTLFGPASIGLNYRPQSVDLLWRHLRLRHWDTPLASMVRGKQPRKLREELPFAQHLDYKSVNALVRQMEGGRTLPILFKHYLQLGGRIAAFHEDRTFGTLDALLVVDLLNAPDKQLRRYVGEEGMRRLREGSWPA
ncbi:Acetyltransferase (GNAT) domain protein [anaerobic digester metagenome]